MELTRLRVFREVARAASFTSAAEVLHMSQPSVSNQIAQLEREVGTRLVERGGRRARLTPAGEVLLGHVEAVLVRLSDAQQEVDETVRLGVRRLRVAAFPTASATLMPPAAGLFRREVAGVQLELTEADPPVAVPALLGGDHDLALTYDYPVLAVPRDRRVALEPLFVDGMAVALPAVHPLAAEPAVDLAALSGEAWCAPHPCMCRDAFELACRRAGFAPQVVSETNDYMAMQGMVASGVGVAVMPRLVAAISVRSGVALRPLAGQVLERMTFVATRSQAPRTRAADALLDALRTAVASIGSPDLPLEPFDAALQPATPAVASP